MLTNARSFFQLDVVALAANWHVSSKTAELVDECCYRSISAPRGVAPPAKKPLAKPSEMTAHHLVNFAKVYGKYLVRSCLDGEFRLEACRLLDIFSMCLASSVAPDHVAKLREAIRLFCLHYNEVWPTQCKALVVHMVLFHMPDTIAYWGPARGYWCFPFERSVPNGDQW